jgi:hypothetical protein
MKQLPRVEPPINAGLNRDESSLVYVQRVVGTANEPAVPDDSINLFLTGVTGSHCGRIVSVGRFTENGPLESAAIGVISIENAGLEWSKQALRLNFLSRSCEPIMLKGAWHRIISEWITVIDPFTHRPVRAGQFEPCPETTAPELDEWLTMPKERVARIAAAFPTPPEVFRKYPDLIDLQPNLCHTLMTNFRAFHRWVNEQPRILESLATAGRAVSVPGGAPLLQMIAVEWQVRGKPFQQWYGEVIQPLCGYRL